MKHFRLVAVVLGLISVGGAWAGGDRDPLVVICNAPLKNDPQGPRLGYSLYVHASGTAFFSIINHHTGGDDVTERYFPVSYRPARPYKGHANAYPASLSDSRGQFVARIVDSMELKHGARKITFSVKATVSQAEEIGANPEVRSAKVECYVPELAALENL